MKKKLGFFAIVATVALVSSGLMAATTETQDLTVGQFAVDLTRLITAKTDVTAESAVQFLGQLGIAFPEGLDADVDQAVLVDAFDRIGVRLTTSSPDQKVTQQDADRLFALFDRQDSLFSAEQFKLCKGGATNQNTACLTDSDCDGGYCQALQSVRCQNGSNDGELCRGDADCPGGTCKIPPGQYKKIIASPVD